MTGTGDRIPAVDQDIALVRRQESGNAAQQRGLAAAGRAQQRQDLPFLRDERAAVEHGEAREALDRIADRNDRGGFRRPGRRDGRSRGDHPANIRSKASTILPRLGATFGQSTETIEAISSGVEGRKAAAPAGATMP